MFSREKGHGQERATDGWRRSKTAMIATGGMKEHGVQFHQVKAVI